MRTFCWLVCGLALLSGEARAQPSDVVVRKTPFSENTLVGANEQPEWTTHRRFPTTRVYVQQPPGAWGLSQWWRMDDSKAKNPRHRFRTEAEIGVARRTQLDLYLDSVFTRDETFYYQDFAAEIRYALADWGRLPLNPTLYYEWKFVDGDQGPDKFEAKLLLGDTLGPDWHYGLNFILEQEVGQARETEYGVSQALGYTLKDRALSLGEEFKYATVTEKDGRSDPTQEFSLGPSLQIRTSHDSHLDLVALFGLSDDAADIETFLVFGCSFGADSKGGPRAPASARAE